MQNLCEKAYENQMNIGSCIHSKDFTIQMSLLLYWLNMVTIIQVSHPEKSNRVQSRSCHVSLIKLDIVAHKFEINNLFILAFLMTKGEIGLNSFRNLYHFLCQIPLYFGLECYMSCMQSIVIHTFSIKINLLVSLQFLEMHKVVYMTMQISSMLLSLFALSDPVGDYSFVYIMTKMESKMW